MRNVKRFVLAGVFLMASCLSLAPGVTFAGLPTMPPELTAEAQKNIKSLKNGTEDAQKKLDAGSALAEAKRKLPAEKPKMPKMPKMPKKSNPFK